MSCCAQEAIRGTDKFFTRTSRRYMKNFRKKGLSKEQRLLLEAITASGIQEKSLLEIGCGVGGLHITLLQKGAGRATGVDIAQGMLEGAKALSRETGMEERTEYILGDFVQEYERIGEADITILDKVVCCYEDVNSLLDKSIASPRNTYALSFPKQNTFLKLFFAVPITMGKLLRWSFHPYWHDWKGLARRIESAGFRQTYRNSTVLWDVRVFRR